MGKKTITGRLEHYQAGGNAIAFVKNRDLSCMVSAALYIYSGTSFTLGVRAFYVDENGAQQGVFLQLVSPNDGVLNQADQSNGNGPYLCQPLHIRAKGGSPIRIAADGVLTDVNYTLDAAVQVLE